MRAIAHGVAPPNPSAANGVHRFAQLSSAQHAPPAPPPRRPRRGSRDRRDGRDRRLIASKLRQTRLTPDPLQVCSVEVFFALAAPPCPRRRVPPAQARAA